MKIDILNHELENTLPHWLTSDQRDPDGKKRKAARRVRRLMQRALKLAASLKRP